MSQKQEALNILKEGLDKVMDDNYHQDIEKLMKDIEKEEQDLFIGELGEKDFENGEVPQTGKLLINESKLNENNDNVNMEHSKISNKDEQKVMI